MTEPNACRWCGGQATAASTDCICTVEALQAKLDALKAELEDCYAELDWAGKDGKALAAKYQRLLAAAKVAVNGWDAYCLEPIPAWHDRVTVKMNALKNAIKEAEEEKPTEHLAENHGLPPVEPFPPMPTVKPPRKEAKG
jgi:hypothetical protein